MTYGVGIEKVDMNAIQDMIDGYEIKTSWVHKSKFNVLLRLDNHMNHVDKSELQEIINHILKDGSRLIIDLASSDKNLLPKDIKVNRVPLTFTVG